MAAAVNLKPEFTVQKPSQLFEGPYANVGGVSYAVTRDGQRFIVLEPAEGEAAPVTHLNVVLNWLDSCEAKGQRYAGSSPLADLPVLILRSKVLDT